MGSCLLVSRQLADGSLTPYRTFKFDIFVADAEKHPPPVELAPALANLLTRMPKLEKLVLVIPEHHIDDFADAFARATFTLPRVHTLVVGTFCDFAVQLCPNATTISNNGWSWLHTKAGKSSGQEHTRALIKAAGRAPKIANLELMNWWTIDLVEAIHEAVPYIPRLSLDGGSYQGGIAHFIPTLSRFKRLEFLALANAHALGVGFSPPRCGNAYMGPHGKEVRERVNHQRQQAEMRVAKMVGPACPVLKELWIGDQTRVEVVRNDDGSFKDVVFHRGLKRERVVHYPRP